MLKIFNTLGRRMEEFKPQKENAVSFYQCGPTVYWTQHIGNLRAMVMGDIIRRSLHYLGYKVTFVRNYTDVGHLVSDEDEGEDKMEKGARQEGLPPKEIAEKYIKVFEDDIRELNILEPNFKPRATAFIPEIIEMVKVLLEKGYAYETSLAVYFEVSKADNYNRLSGQDERMLEEGAGAGHIEDAEKRNHRDFALWFFKAGAHKNALQTWEGPFHSPLVENGRGFPGWHIECSAMSKKYLGPTLDIHMGGVEHIPIHHTNEIAQSEAANEAPFVNYWLHNEHLTVEDKKMAKSEGTSYSLEEVKAKGFNPLALRYFFLQAHYRSKQNFTWGALEGAESGLKHIYDRVKSLKGEIGSSQQDETGGVDKDLRDQFIKVISDDFNTPQAMAVLQEVLKKDINDEDKLATILDFDKVFGLKIKEVIGTDEIIPEEVITLANKREEARKNKNWEESDKLRREIENLGYEIRDEEKGYEIRKKTV
ncbi:MAG TPA: cysteine--tRNA ligase [Candidatus Paceibacterota bacterium]